MSTLKDGVLRIADVPGVIAEAAGQFGVAPDLEARSVLVNLDEKVWANHWTQIRLGGFGDRAFGRDRDISLGAMRVLTAAVGRFDPPTSEKLASLLAPWSDSQLDDLVMAASLGDFGESARAAHFPSNNDWGSTPCWTLDLPLRVSSNARRGLPSGPFLDPVTGLGGERVGTIAASWLRDASVRNETTVEDGYRIVLPDRGGFFTSVAVRSHRLRAGVDGVRLKGAKVMVAFMDAHKNETLETLDADSGSFELKVPGNAESASLTLFDRAGVWLDRSFIQLVRGDTKARRVAGGGAGGLFEGVAQPVGDRLVWGEWEAIDPKPKYVTRMSNVWRVRRASDASAEPFALKELKYPKPPTSAAYRRFEREIKALRKLSKSSEGIVGVVDYALSEETPQPYYVMPLAETSLKRAARALKGNLEQVLKIGVQIADGLAAAHAEGIVHRDVKPENVLLFGDEQAPKVADFGICYLQEEERLTRTEGDTVGTEEYVAPELRGGGKKQNIVPAVDVYSLGKTLYETVSGGVQLPREWLNRGEFDLVKLLEDDRLEHYMGLFVSMITESPEGRYQTMADCRGQMERAIENIRNGVRYRPGMYGGAQSPVERYVRLSTQMRTLQSPQREDKIQDAAREAWEAARDQAIRAGRMSNILRGPAGEPRYKARVAAAESAEEFLSAGVPVVEQDDQAAAEEWCSMLASAVRTQESAETEGERWILPVAATLALHGAGALAWYRRRLRILGRLVDAQLRTPDQWVHHYVLGDVAPRVIPWVLDALRSSAVLRKADESLVNEIEACVASVAGLVVLRGLFALSDEELAALRSQGRPPAALPGFYAPAAAWVKSLPRRLIDNPRFAEEVGKEVFDLGPESFRSQCSRVTAPLFYFLQSRVQPQEQALSLGDVTKDWRAWCTGEQA